MKPRRPYPSDISREQLELVRPLLESVRKRTKPRLVKLAITRQGEDPFALGGSSRKATHYVVKVEIGGVAGLVAPFLGKQPPDTDVWSLSGDAPAFVKVRLPPAEPVELPLD